MSVLNKGKNRFSFGTFFQRCGLSADKNILQRMKCDCGCGGYLKISAESLPDIFDFSADVLAEGDCGYCAMFIIDIDHNIFMMIRDDEDDQEDEDDACFQMYKIGDSTKDYHYAGDNFDLLELHCFGLIYEVEPGLWDIADC